jgi:hypothetical protein
MLWVEELDVILHLPISVAGEYADNPLVGTDQGKLVGNADDHSASFGQKPGHDPPQSTEVWLIVSHVTHDDYIEPAGQSL